MEIQSVYVCCVSLHHPAGLSCVSTACAASTRLRWCTRVCCNIYFCDLQRRDSNDDERDGSTKKPRVVWSVEMHQQFVNAVNQLGIDSEPSFHLMYQTASYCVLVPAHTA